MPVGANPTDVRVSISNTHALEKTGLFSRATLTYTLALGIILSDAELAAIEQKNLYSRVIYEPPWHPQWRVKEDELPPALLVYNLVEIHNAATLAAVGYYPDDHEAHIGESKLREELTKLKDILALTRSQYDEFDL